MRGAPADLSSGQSLLGTEPLEESPWKDLCLLGGSAAAVVTMRHWGAGRFKVLFLRML